MSALLLLVKWQGHFVEKSMSCNSKYIKWDKKRDSRRCKAVNIHHIAFMPEIGLSVIWIWSLCDYC